MWTRLNWINIFLQSRVFLNSSVACFILYYLYVAFYQRTNTNFYEQSNESCSRTVLIFLQVVYSRPLPVLSTTIWMNHVLFHASFSSFLFNYINAFCYFLALFHICHILSINECLWKNSNCCYCHYSVTMYATFKRYT